MANEILGDASEKYDCYDDALDFINDQVHEASDGCSMVIYTGQAIDVLKYSDSWLAGEEAGLELAEGISQLVSALAYHAVCADIFEACESNQDQYFEDEDESEGEDESEAEDE